jgi:hypothetical protein
MEPLEELIATEAIREPIARYPPAFDDRDRAACEALPVAWRPGPPPASQAVLDLSAPTMRSGADG